MVTGARSITFRDRTDARDLYSFELEPEVREWLDSLSDGDYKRVDEVCGLLAEKGSELGGPCSDHLLTAFRENRQHEQRQIDRAVRGRLASATTKGPATERQV